MGQWEEVNPAEDYFEKNAYISEDDDSSDLDPELKKIEEKLEESSQKLEEKSEVLKEKSNKKEENHENIIEIVLQKEKEKNKDAIDELLEYKDQTNFGKSELKLKNERLIKLAEQNFELGVFEKPTYKKGNAKEEVIKNATFKKRKNNNSKAILINPDESP